MENDEENQIDDLVAFFETEIDDNEQEDGLIGFDDDLADMLQQDDDDDENGDYGIVLPNEDDENSKQEGENKVNTDTDTEIDSIKDEICGLKARLQLLKEKLAEKEMLRDARKVVTKKKDTVKKLSKADSGIVKKEEGGNKRKLSDLDLPFKKKERIAHTPTHDAKMNRSGFDNVHVEKKKINIDMKKPPKPKEAPDERPWETEGYSGIRIINPRISSQQMESRMDGRRFIKLPQIGRNIINNEINDDWVTVGVIANKLPPKTSANGKTFSIWKLSELCVGHENETITLFLFGDIYKEHWKTNEGMVIALLNASIMPQRNNDKIGTIAITIDSPKKLMILGIAKDFGYCKGSTKSGRQCSFVVNKFLGEYCEHHVAREYKKTKAQRMEFQSGSTGPDAKKGQLMKSVRKGIDSGDVFYGGKAVTWTDMGATKKKTEAKKKTLNLMTGSSSSSGSFGCSGKISPVESTSTGCASNRERTDFGDPEELSEDFKVRLQVPTTGSRNLLRFLKKDEEEEKEKQTAIKVEVKTAKDLLLEQKRQEKRSSKPVAEKTEQTPKSIKPIDLNLSNLKEKSKVKAKPPAFDTNFKPKIGGSFRLGDEDDFIEFSDSTDVISNSLNSKNDSESIGFPKINKTPVASKSLNTDVAKRKAIALVRSKEIKIKKTKEKPTTTKKKSPEAIAKINERVLRDISVDESENCEPAKKRRKGILDDAFGKLDLESKEGKKILETKSAYDNLVREAEAEREAAYFHVLEKKEMYEEKMKNIVEKKVKVVCCKICKYMHQYQSELCKKENHPIVRVEAVKRFFNCKNCKLRVDTYKKMPTDSCKKCGCQNYERTSMFQEKKGPNIGGETLLVRGEEHGKFFNSLK